MSLLADIDRDTRAITGGEFSEQVDFTYPVSFSINALFDETFVTKDPETGAKIMSDHPRITVSKSELEELAARPIDRDPEEAWELRVRNKKFYVHEPQDDGQGLLVLELLSIPDFVPTYEIGAEAIAAEEDENIIFIYE